MPASSSDRPYVVAITGGSGAGKSAVARCVADQLGDCTLLQQDDYYRPLPDEVSAWDHNFDHPDAFDADRLLGDLDALLERRAVAVTQYRHGQSATGRRMVRPAGTIIVEGILILADERLRARCDLTVYLETEDRLRLERRLRRDTAERGVSQAFVLDHWRRFTLPAHKTLVEPFRPFCDLVLTESTPEDAARKILEAAGAPRRPTSSA